MIEDTEGVRSLQFSRNTVQSAMRLADPFGLELSDTRAMMGFPLFKDKGYSPHWLDLTMKAGKLKVRYFLEHPWIVKNMRLRDRT